MFLHEDLVDLVGFMTCTDDIWEFVGLTRSTSAGGLLTLHASILHGSQSP